MIFQILFYLSLIAITVGCIAAARIITRRPLKPFARNLLIGLIIFEIITAVLHVYAITVLTGTFWDWFFDLQYEFNLGAIFSALQFMLIAIIALVNGVSVPRLTLSQRLYWLLLFVLFVFLSIDEYYAIHETWGGRVETNAWRIPYAIGGITLAAVSFLAYWFRFRDKPRLFGLLFIGFAIMGIAGIGVEEFLMRGFVDADPSLQWLYVIEEVFEMVGGTIVLAAFISYTQENVDAHGWTRAKKVLLVGGSGWLGWLLFVLLGQAALEARFLATPLDVRYSNGLSLVAYTMTPEVVNPGGEVEITLYWRTDTMLDTNYSLSLHALSHPDIASVAQSDDLHLGTIPSTGWIPGVVTKRTFYMQLPRNLPTPESYLLLTRVWFGPWPLGRPWEDTTGVPLTTSGNLPTISEDGLILDRIIALPVQEPPPPDTASDFAFAQDGFTLYGYELPQDDVTLRRLPIGFWWRTDAAGERDLTQFLHLIPAAGGETIALDGKPFDGSFPTQDWVAGMQVRDMRTMPLPDDLQPGTYDVYTGLYAPDSGERAAVNDADGQSVLNSAILLGRIDFAPAYASADEEPPPGIDLADYCFGVADIDLLRDDGQDMMVAMHKQTREVITLGRTGTISLEGMTFNPDGDMIYGVDDLETHGQFVAGDPRLGWLDPVGTGLTPPGQPARNRVLPPDILIDVDGLSIDAEGHVWAVTQDERNLFEIDPETGLVVRNRFGDGNDFIHIAIAHLPGGDYVKIEDLAIDQRDGTFYILATSEDFMTMLATVDPDDFDPATGTVVAQEVGPFVNADTGAMITDVEGLSFDTDGTFYAISTDNSNDPANHDTLWRIDLDGVRATRIGQFSQHVDYVDIEAIACAGRASAD